MLAKPLIPSILLISLLTGGCVTPPSKANTAADEPPARAPFAEVLVSQLSGEDDEGEGLPTESFEERAQRILGESSSSAELPERALDQEILYKYLLSEIAGQRGNYQLAAQGYYDLAKSTRDPRLAKRATEAANYARLGNLALDAAKLWYELDKNSKQARQALTNALVSSNKIQEAKPHLRQLIAGESNPGVALLQLNQVLARHQDKNAVLTLVQEVAKDYPQAPEAHFAVAQSAVGASKFELAHKEIDEALRLRPDWEAAHLFKAQLIQQRDSADKAAEYLAGAVAQYPDAKDLRLYYGRSLVGAKKLPEARVQYETLLKDFPNNADLVVTTGLICLQLADFRAAEGHLSKALGLNYKDPEAIKYYLGQTFEEQKRDQEALDWYREVAGGEQFIAAHSRYAGILARQGKLAQAREYLRQVKTTSDAQRVELVRAEAQLLREKKAYQEAYDVLKTELDRQPDNVELLYDAAMMAERLNKIDVLETNLRRVIALKPDHAQAYNALGYTLADRNLRLQEAKQLLDKAHKLAPDDAFILDSVGWVYYRLGNLQDALEYLQRAYAQRQDPEIAAHLGEVLWKLGRSEEAEKVLRESMKLHAENDVLAETVKRLLP